MEKNSRSFRTDSRGKMAKRYAPHLFAKLDVDFFGAASLYTGMQSQDDHGRLRLIGALLPEAGRLMEDTSPSSPGGCPIT